MDTDDENLRSTKNVKNLTKIISPDIKSIQEALNSGDEKQLKAVHMEIDGKYSAYIKNFGQSMYAYDKKYGFTYEYLDKESLIHNLLIMKGRLTGYVNIFKIDQNSTLMQNINLNVPISNKNEQNMNFSFENAKSRIENLPGLSEKDTENVKSRIDELEKINNSKMSKKRKWEKVKPIVLFVLDKGADVAITIMNLILQMKLGM